MLFQMLKALTMSVHYSFTPFSWCATDVASAALWQAGRGGASSMRLRPL